MFPNRQKKGRKWGHLLDPEIFLMKFVKCSTNFLGAVYFLHMTCSIEDRSSTYDRLTSELCSISFFILSFLHETGLNPWSRLFLVQLTILHPVKFPALTGPKVSSHCSWQPALVPWSERVHFTSSCSFLKICFNIIVHTTPMSLK
jgi:hypothetical protein